MAEHDVCRSLLTSVMKEVRRNYTAEEIKKAWVWSDGHKHFEFHGPNEEYLYNLKMTDCLWSARAAGWIKLLEAQGITVPVEV